MFSSICAFPKTCSFPGLNTFWLYHVANIYLFKVNNRNSRKRCGICSDLTLKTPERRHWLHSDVFIVNFENISQLFLVFPLLTLTLNKEMLAGHGLRTICTIVKYFIFGKSAG